MAGYTSTANIILTVNGKQAQKMLTQLEKDAKRLEQGISKAAVAGDKATMKKLQRELNNTKKMMEQLKDTASTADVVLRRLDKATPKELNKALKQLQQQLNGIQRGTPAWDAHVAKIRMVKAELQKVNATLATQQSLWKRMNNWLNNAQTAIMAVAAAVTGLVMAARKAVSSYADMEETMANTIKYTRMTAAEVEELNEIFKGMDTRLAREQLNLLAQEGGRLGYNTVASVKEYVEAASIINVALVDLGEGATQTIAKLSNIFGMEQMYGVRDSMLKIGSTVNHLSQNCTAAKPFIVEFAQRMAGIGSTAKMTIPEIMAFAATLDAHGQKVEMSATALQRTIMELYKKPAEMAKKVGLETNTFIETLNRSTTEGVMMFLEALNKLGENQALAVLSPLFQDLGLDGARVSSVLSNLSSHLDFLRWQMGEAAEAFREGTSASNEYAIFNNTVQASIDKARKRVSELAIELGEKLFPLMKHIYTSSSIFLRVLNTLVDFIIEHRKAIANVIKVIAVYYGWIVLCKTASVLWHAVLGVGKAIMIAYRTALILGRIAMIAFTQGIGAATHAFKLLNTVVKANPFGLLLSVLAAVFIAVKALCDRTSEFTKKMREARNTAATFGAELKKEMVTIDTLIGRLKAAEKGTKKYKEVKDEILKQYGKYLKGLINERGEINNLTAAYNRLAAAARIAAKERAIQTARDTASETYGDAMKEWAGKLQQSLIDEGKSLQDAVRITNRVVYELQTTGTLNANLVAELQAIKGNLWDANGMTDHPVNLVNQMIAGTTEYNVTMSDIANLEREENPLAEYTVSELRRMIADFEPKVTAGQGGRIIIGMRGNNPEVRNLNASELAEFLEEARARLSLMESPSEDIVAGNPDFTLDDYTPYETDADRRKAEQERKKEEAAARRAETKAKQEFKSELNDAKGVWEAADAQNISDFSAGLKSWTQFLLDKHNAEMAYFDERAKIYKKWNLEEDEDYQELLKKKAESEAAWLKKNAAIKVDEAKRKQQTDETQAQMNFATPGHTLYQNEEALNQELHKIRIKYLGQMQAAYQQGTEEYHNYAVQIEQAEAAEQLRRQKLYAQRIAEWKKKYEYQEAGARMKLELDLLEEIHDKQLISEEEYQRAKRDIQKKYATEYLPDSAKPDSGSASMMAEQKKRDLDIVADLEKQGVLTHEQAEKAKDRINKTYSKKQLDAVRKFGSTETNQLLDIYEAWQNFFSSTEEDGGNWATRLAALASSVFSVMTAGMQQASEYMQACADLETAKVEKKYDREIELAEGNSYKVKKAEKDKEKEIAKIKNETNRKMFAMQIIQAVAQTATNAINAYGSAAAVPVIGYILAPIAAGMAVAAGMLQIATIKKQQQASEAQGYMTGGFTPEGKADEVAGVVHKGEWVASQALVNNPRTRPLLEALDYAQRTNTIGSIKMSDVSRTITAPAVLAAQPSAAPTIVNNTYNSTVPTADNSTLQQTLNRLNDRLNEPIGAIVTVAGDYGIERAKEEYDLLMRNKSPKSKK
ncbi:MAG: phage tail tape measure protein [Muribaculaceae bacterium]|nr:phage tail tape measure protein [Muribaculaceae bacterium]